MVFGSINCVEHTTSNECLRNLEISRVYPHPSPLSLFTVPFTMLDARLLYLLLSKISSWMKNSSLLKNSQTFIICVYCRNFRHLQKVDLPPSEIGSKTILRSGGSVPPRKVYFRAVGCIGLCTVNEKGQTLSFLKWFIRRAKTFDLIAVWPRFTEVDFSFSNDLLGSFDKKSPTFEESRAL
jgi:hypothetical protein